jgi:hypothetical protein
MRASPYGRHCSDPSLAVLLLVWGRGANIGRRCGAPLRVPQAHLVAPLAAEAQWTVVRHQQARPRVPHELGDGRSRVALGGGCGMQGCWWSGP